LCEPQPATSASVAAATTVKAFRTMRFSRPTGRSLPKMSHDAHWLPNEIDSQFPS
jgi:hypothetical protein